MSDIGRGSRTSRKGSIISRNMIDQLLRNGQATEVPVDPGANHVEFAFEVIGEERTREHAQWVRRSDTRSAEIDEKVFGL